MRVLFHSEVKPAVPNVYAEVHALRCSADSDDWKAADTGIRLLGTQEGRVVRLGQVWPQRNGDPQAGEGAAAYWAGMYVGIRPPGPQETPLSWEEIQHAREKGIL